MGLLLAKPGGKLTTVAPTTAAAGDTSVEEEEEIDPFGTIWLSLVKVNKTRKILFHLTVIQRIWKNFFCESSNTCAIRFELANMCEM